MFGVKSNKNLFWGNGEEESSLITEESLKWRGNLQDKEETFICSPKFKVFFKSTNFLCSLESELLCFKELRIELKKKEVIIEWITCKVIEYYKSLLRK